MQRDLFNEVRDGFYIPGMIKRSWAFDMMEYQMLEKVCEENGSRCSVMWGTLLGAIRNGGFIPWDDDVDTQMLREDYVRIEKISRAGELPDDRWISDYVTEERENMVRRWMTAHSLIEKYENWDKHYGFPFVGIIDIFVQDAIPTDKEEWDIYWKTILLAGELKEKAKAINGTLDLGFHKQVKKMAEMLGYDLTKESGKPLFIRILEGMDAFCSRYTTDNNENIGIPAYVYNNRDLLIPKLLYSDYIKIPFENIAVSVPIGYDGILRRIYGKYVIPKVARGLHDYPAYEKMNKDAREVGGFELLKYKYNVSEITNIKDRRNQYQNDLFESLRESLELLDGAHTYLLSSYRNNSITEEVMEVFIECQNLAINIGKTLEEKALHYENSVKCLEEYCEVIYKAYNDSLEGIPDIEVFTKVSEIINKLKTEISQVKEIKDVVILSWNSSEWKGLHTVWKALKETEGVNVVVIAVPYYYKDNYNTIIKGSMIVDDSGYPDEVPLTDYDKYDFEKHHPFAIIYTDPYDEYDTAKSIHPYYYASNLYQYTNNMILIPSFRLREISDDEYPAIYTYGEFLKEPGIVLANKVCVQSDPIKKTAMEILADFMDVSKEVLDEKLFVSGLPIEDWETRERVLFCHNGSEKISKEGLNVEVNEYDEILEVSDHMFESIRNGNGKKNLIYMLGGSMLLEHGEKGILKAKAFLSFMSDRYRDAYNVIWYDDPLARPILEKNDHDIWEQYLKLRDDFIKMNIGYVIENDENEIACSLADCMYGDAGVLMEMLRRREIPILWETPGVTYNDTRRNVELGKWDKALQIVTEGDNDSEWTIDEFLRCILEYDNNTENTNNGRRIANYILGGSL